jgi:hypothetical protein
MTHFLPSQHLAEIRGHALVNTRHTRKLLGMTIPRILFMDTTDFLVYKVLRLPRGA